MMVGPLTWGLLFLCEINLASTVTNARQSMVSAKISRFPWMMDQSMPCARRHPQSVLFARKKESDDLGARVKEAMRQSIRDGGARPIAASDALRKIQTEQPQLVAGIFAVILLAFIASVVYGF
mmetsp:Transcript_38679/g.75077  ORF Transcript_38679/g.75077 Transcript_38679/m.75077 type:complete len:123 (+) Transcript_38679:39-407(+)